ncbi:hypothetical protein B0T21DRAFT_379979 [Apiosordaria backusii]|uniref:Multiple RNA-binding domain-containing protein 1 n=1 Tax=Apiosordaria backusii TaxID=314023 RepID=A0AA40EYT7_9PEZI|nr:hypothetical protein B0T21DRAFT_379979 [Apiosordaria backusii]
MESSRIFVKNLPPSISEADFRKHFSAQGREVTDVKLIPNRRIGFVGYKSHEDAAKAVKYFNKSFIRMSRIGVDLAKPIEAAIPKSATQAAHVPSRDAAKAPSLVKSRAPEAESTEDDASSKKRKRDLVDEADPKFQEYLEVMGHPTKKARDGEAVGNSALESETTAAIPSALIEGGESDDEYEEIPVRPKRPIEEAPTLALPVATPVAAIIPPAPSQPADEPAMEVPQVPAEATDDDWLRSRTNRLLDLVDPDDPGFSARSADAVPVATKVPLPEEQVQTAQEPDLAPESEVEKHDVVRTPEDAVKLIEKTARLFLRNLSYTVTEDNVRDHFGQFGDLEEVHVPLDNRGQSKGFAMIRYAKPGAALSAFQTDGTVFQGRIIHIIPAAAKRESKLDEYAISKLPLKKQQLLKKKAEAASSTFNWNSLFMSQDAVNNAVAERLGVSKHELLDPTDASAAVKQAIAETTVIQEAKAYFATHGVNIDAFKSQQRGDTSILVKNIKNATIEELRTLFEEHGSVLRVLMPPSGTIAIVQFAQPAHCRAAFARKAYSRFKDSVLYLEKGPKGLFVDNVSQPADRPAGLQKVSASDLLERDDAEDQPETASLFVRNLNFSTTTEGLTNAFKPLDGFVGAQVKTKTDPKKPGQVLSMGFGFCAFKTKEQAQAAQKAMDGHVLDGYKLLVKASHRGMDAAEERRREDLAKKAAAQRTKVVIKNLPFEASKKDVRALFSNYGKLVALRIPKKFNHSSRGFAFAEFSTAKEALNALTALKDTHLLGRRLVLDFAEAEDLDPEEQIKAMEKKMRGQASKVALQQLTGAGRSKPLHRPPSPAVPRGCRQPRGGTVQVRSQAYVSTTAYWEGFCSELLNIHIVLGSHSRSLAMRLPVLPSQCYSPSPDYGLEGRHGTSASRQPLRESTGNAQHSHMAWYSEQIPQLAATNGLASMSPSIPTPPIVPTQSFGPDYGSASLVYGRPQQRHHLQGHRVTNIRRRLFEENPLIPLLPAAFQNYRKKQADKTDQKWSDVLEWGFIDALVLIPQMKRKKYTMNQSQYGRNMLIGEYLWIYYFQTLPPGSEPDCSESKHRKQVSSHIQVLKGFFANHRCFHFFFGSRSDEKDKDSIETISLKNNPVLIALSEGRLPDERPNYEYFADILALNDQVTVQPKRCWIFVSHQGVSVREDGSGFLPSTGDKLDESEYPHLARNLERETWLKEEQQIFKGALLHEFTKEMQQIESTSVNGLGRKWETSFPELYQRLHNITETTTDQRCTILHMNVTLELKEKRRFPSQSELNSWVEINIEQPRLLSHRWKVYTRLVRPAELSYSHENSSPETTYETSAEIAIQYQHRPGCDGPRADGRAHCDCISQRRHRDSVTVPFPADIWASTLTNCAEYPAHPFTDGGKNGKRNKDVKVKSEEDGEEGAKSNRRSKPLTQMDLVPKIAMMQEIWSCPPDPPQYGPDPQGNGASSRRWTRRAVIVWTFKTIHSEVEGKLVTAQSGRTEWRYLTILDPMSEEHQQRAIISGSRKNSAVSDYADGYSSHHPRPVSRDVVMSPSPTYQQHLNASMSENFSSAWDAPTGLNPLSTSAAQAYSAHLMAQPTQSHVSGLAQAAGYSPLDSFSSHGGLATPPPSASLTTSFTHNFDTTSTQPDLMATYMSTHSTATTTAGLDADPTLNTLAAVTDPFLTNTNTSFDAMNGYDQSHWTTSSGLAGPSNVWSQSYPSASTYNHSTTLTNWPQPPAQPPSHRGSLSDNNTHHSNGGGHSQTGDNREDHLSQSWEEVLPLPIDLSHHHTTQSHSQPTSPTTEQSTAAQKLEKAAAAMELPMQMGSIANGNGEVSLPSNVEQERRNLKRRHSDSFEDGDDAEDQDVVEFEWRRKSFKQC